MSKVGTPGASASSATSGGVMLAVITGILISLTIFAVAALTYLMYLTEGCTQACEIDDRSGERLNSGRRGVTSWKPAGHRTL
jgi:hypothetical protein